MNLICDDIVDFVIVVFMIATAVVAVADVLAAAFVVAVGATVIVVVLYEARCFSNKHSFDGASFVLFTLAQLSIDFAFFVMN